MSSIGLYCYFIPYVFKKVSHWCFSFWHWKSRIVINNLSTASSSVLYWAVFCSLWARSGAIWLNCWFLVWIVSSSASAFRSFNSLFEASSSFYSATINFFGL
jgi:hypothetical protein